MRGWWVGACDACLCSRANKSGSPRNKKLEIQQLGSTLSWSWLLVLEKEAKIPEAVPRVIDGVGNFGSATVLDENFSLLESCSASTTNMHHCKCNIPLSWTYKKCWSNILILPLLSTQKSICVKYDEKSDKLFGFISKRTCFHCPLKRDHS